MTVKPKIDHVLLGSILAKFFPEAWGAYLFGSAASGEIREGSDLDIAVLQERVLSPETVIGLKGEISQKFRRDSDIVDLLRADSVSAAQVIAAGIPIVSRQPAKMAHFETMAFSRYALLNEERAEILADIQEKGTIHHG